MSDRFHEYTTILVYANPYTREIVEVRRRHAQQPFIGGDTGHARMLEALTGQGCEILGEWVFEPASNGYRRAEVGRFLLDNLRYTAVNPEYGAWARWKAVQLVAAALERQAVTPG